MNWPSSRLLSTQTGLPRDLSFREPLSSTGFRPARTRHSAEDLPWVLAVNQWLFDCLSSGDTVLAPAIIYYEVRRELLRAQKTTGLARLDAFVQIDSTRYLALTDEALRLAAELWAKARQQRHPTSPKIDIAIH